MKRRTFLGRLLAALGVGGSLGLHSRQSAVPDPLMPVPTDPLANLSGWTLEGWSFPKTYFVDESINELGFCNGSDQNDGLSMRSPFRTVARAYDAMARKGDVIYCLPGPGHEGLGPNV